MKLLPILFVFGASVALANETVYPTPEELAQCKADKDAGIGPPTPYGNCCTYNDCPTCGIFWERCCHKPSEHGSDVGECLCGVDARKQGSCFWWNDIVVWWTSVKWEFGLSAVFPQAMKVAVGFFLYCKCKCRGWTLLVGIYPNSANHSTSEAQFPGHSRATVTIPIMS